MKRYIYLLGVLFIASINFNLFLKPFGLVTGGTQGLGLVISSFFGINVWVVILIINVLMLIVSFLFLSHRTTIGTIVSTFVYPFFIKFTDFNFSFDFSFFYVFFSGILCGINSGIIYKLGFSSGGINVFPLILNKFFGVKVFISVFFMNFFILFFSFSLFGFFKCFCSFFIILISSFVIGVFLKSN